MKLVDAIDRRTRGRVRIHPGLSYKTLAQLVDRGLVRRRKKPDSVAAAVYELTAKGRRYAEREGAELARLFKAGGAAT